MANFEIDEDQAALIRELRKLETSDPVHANVYNALFEKLINNDAFLERLANKMIEKSMLCHVLDSVNAQQVLAADVGPKITAITNELKENVSVLNTKITNMCSDIQTAQNGFKYITLGTIFIAWGYLQGGGTSSFSDIASSLLSVTISPNKINSNGDKVSAPVAAIKEDNSTIVNYDTGPGTGTPKIRCNVLVTGIVL